MTRTLRFPRIITTPRLRLTAAGPADAESQTAAVNASLAEFGPWFPWAQKPTGVDAARERLTTDAANFDAGRAFDWLIRLPGQDEVVGRISLFNLEPDVSAGEIGYWLATAHTGRGYMREATQAVTNTALALGFRRIEIRCDSANVRSSAVPEALGFHRDAILRNAAVSADDPTRLRHTLIYSRTV